MFAVFGSSGCELNHWAHNGFKVEPNCAKPAAPVACEWIDYQDPHVHREPADLATIQDLAAATRGEIAQSSNHDDSAAIEAPCRRKTLTSKTGE